MEKKLDHEWVCLMMEAKQMGIPIGEIRRFLQQRSLTEISQLEIQK